MVELPDGWRYVLTYNNIDAEDSFFEIRELVVLSGRMGWSAEPTSVEGDTPFEVAKSLDRMKDAVAVQDLVLVLTDEEVLTRHEFDRKYPGKL